jgi:hypothetical protein
MDHGSRAHGFRRAVVGLCHRSCVRVQSCGGSRSFVAAGAPDWLNARARPGPADSSSRAHGFAQRKPKLPPFLSSRYPAPKVGGCGKRKGLVFVGPGAPDKLLLGILFL